MQDKLIETIIDLGFVPNRHGDAMDLGNFRVFEIDGALTVLEFNNPKAQTVEWRTDLSLSIPLPKLIKTLRTLVS